MRADGSRARAGASASPGSGGEWQAREDRRCPRALRGARGAGADEFEIGRAVVPTGPEHGHRRSEEHTSELQSRSDIVCRLLLEKKYTYRSAELLLTSSIT